MMSVVKRDGTLAIFPEGIQSTSGSTHPINPATVRFIKHCKANVVVSTSRGAYLATNRYSKDRKKGHIGVEYSLALTPDMIERLSEKEIYDLLLNNDSIYVAHECYNMPFHEIKDFSKLIIKIYKIGKA